MESSFDLIIIGSGPGGYIAAIRGAQLGYKTAIIERYPVLGGTCTNVGCIPSKAMLDSTELYYSILHKAPRKGIIATDVSLNFAELVQRNRHVVKQNTDGLDYLMKKNKIQVYHGLGSFIDKDHVQVTDLNGAVTILSSKFFIIATGSKPSTLPGVVIDKKRIITSTEALYLSEKPKSMVIIGGGVIGVEMASVFNRIGTKVTIIEYSNGLLPAMDKELGKELQRIITRQGVEVITGHSVIQTINEGNSVKVSYQDREGKLQLSESDYCLVAVGRHPYTENLGIENTAVTLDEKGRVIVDVQLRTTQHNIYAIGDVIGGAMLAHKAEDEAVVVVDSIHGQSSRIHYSRIPNVVYTWPEVAGVGYTEQQLIEEKIEYRKGKFPFIASGRARASDDTEGFVKVLTDPKYGEILGVHIVGARAADLIAEAVLAMEFEITDTELGRISYAHPTFSEALKDAYLAASGRGALNM